MRVIKYVCLSDLHLGEEDSLLTGITEEGKAAPDKLSPVLGGLAECFRDLLKDQEDKPTLILCGDVLELALCTMDVAGMAFETFLRSTMRPGEELFAKSIFYLPGNHDHHLWELARETQYVEWFKRHALEGIPLAPPRHITPLIQLGERQRVPSYFLNGLLKRLARQEDNDSWNDIKFSVRYPNMGIAEGDRLALFSHGHYLESAYGAVSTAKDLLFDSGRPGSMNELEAHNFAWIDFFWSALGRSGDAGESVEMVYENLRSKEKVAALIENLARNISSRYMDNLPGWIKSNSVLSKIFKILYAFFRGREREVTDTAMSEKLRKGLHEYLENYLRGQIEKDLPGRDYRRVIFTFGHTHKPLAMDMTDFDGYPTWVDVYNTGGWVVDEVEPQPVHGASAVLLDEELNAAAVRLYQEKKDGGIRPVAVSEADHLGEAAGPFKKYLAEKVASSTGPWADLTDVVGREVSKRREFLRARIEMIEKNRPAPSLAPRTKAGFKSTT